VTLVELHRARMIVTQDVVRGDHLLTHARVVLACLDRTSRRPTSGCQPAANARC